jgi:hypothetical protein
MIFARPGAAQALVVWIRLRAAQADVVQTGSGGADRTHFAHFLPKVFTTLLAPY